MPSRASGRSPRSAPPSLRRQDVEDAEQPPASWRSPRAVAVGSALILIVATAGDVLTTDRVIVLTVFFGLSPLLASSTLRPAATAGFATAAVVLAAGSETWNQEQGAQYWVRLVDVALVGALSVLVTVIRARRETDLRASRLISTAAQQALLPVLPRHLGVVEVATRYHSATRAAQVGGDFYDFVADRGRTRLILGDVSGKGVDAVGQAARVIRAFRQYGASEPDLLAVARRMDEYVLPFWEWEYFATAVLVEVSDDRMLTVVSAGHPPPLHLSADGVDELPVEPSVPLGLGRAKVSTRHRWRPSDRLLLYTDGLTEARNAAGQFLPRAAIEHALQAPSLDAGLDELLETVEDHAGGFTDDLALLLMANGASGPQGRQR